MVRKNGTHNTTFYWKSFDCELCKTQFPNSIKTSDQNIALKVISYELPQVQNNEVGHYIVLESVSPQSSKVIHVINLKNTDAVNMGRGHDQDIRITDISVSRFHALIKKNDKGYFYIQDNQSKFGTLVLIKNPFMLNPNEVNYIQAGRSLLEIQIRRPISVFSNCFCSNTAAPVVKSTKAI